MSALAAVEVHSTIRRRQRMGEIENADSETALEFLRDEMRRVVEQPVTGNILSEARRAIDHHGLRALDAIQLASALVARDMLTRADRLLFIASDLKLLQAAREDGLEVWDSTSALPNESDID